MSTFGTGTGQWVQRTNCMEVENDRREEAGT